ncbi:hypothetical protein ACRAWD_28265 [Caulobacter segnis]
MTGSATASSSRSPTAAGRWSRFGGRAMDPNARAKYLNGPETGLFHKGRGAVLACSRPAKILHAGAVGPRRTRGTPMVVVEGYMDVIASPSARACRPCSGHGHGPDRGADGGPVAAASRGRPCASTATRPASAPPTAPSTGALPLLKLRPLVPLLDAGRRQGP